MMAENYLSRITQLFYLEESLKNEQGIIFVFSNNIRSKSSYCSLFYTMILNGSQKFSFELKNIHGF